MVATVVGVALFGFLRLGAIASLVETDTGMDATARTEIGTRVAQLAPQHLPTILADVTVQLAPSLGLVAGTLLVALLVVKVIWCTFATLGLALTVAARSGAAGSVAAVAVFVAGGGLAAAAGADGWVGTSFYQPGSHDSARMQQKDQSRGGMSPSSRHFNASSNRLVAPTCSLRVATTRRTERTDSPV